MIVVSFILLAIAGLVYLLRYPQVAFALFIFSYVIEGSATLPWYLNLTLITFAIASLGFMTRVSLRKKNAFELRLPDLYLLGFIVILFAGSYLVPNPQGGFIKALRFVGLVALPYLLTRVFLNEPSQVYRFLKAILISSFIVTVILIYAFLLGSPKMHGGRVLFLEANSISVATFFGVGLVIAVIEAMMPSQKAWKLSRIVCVVMIPVFFYGIFLTGMRGPFIAAIFGLTFYFLFGFVKRITPKFRITCVIALISIVVVFKYFGHIFPNIEAYSPMAIRQGPSTAQRIEQYELFTMLFPQSPLFGIGTNGFEQLTRWDYPHNIFMEVAVENGLVGLIFFGTFLAVIGLCGFRFLFFYYPHLSEKVRKMGLMIMTISIVLLIGRQFSFGLDMHKDLFVFLGLIVNLPIIVHSGLIPNRKILEDTK